MAELHLREYRGTGKVVSELGSTVECDFVLRQSSSGKRTLSCTTSDPSALRISEDNEKKRPLRCRFDGLVSQPSARVVASQTCLANSTYKMEQGRPETFGLELLPLEPVEIEYQQVSVDQKVEYRIGLSNLVFLGTHSIAKHAGKSPSRIDVRIAEQDIFLESSDWYYDLTKRLEDGPGIDVTAHLVTTDLLGNRSLVRQICNDLCVLLSFATCNWISPLYEDCFLDGQRIVTTLLPAKTFRYNPGERVIDAREGNELKEYLETTYPNYIRLKDALGMNIVMEYFVHSRLMNLFEIKYLIAAIGMECLKSHLPDYFAAKCKTVDVTSFRSSLRELFRDIPMPYQQSELDFIEVRDKIVHTGKFPPNVECVEEYQKLLNLCDRTTLTVLGYRGKPYLNSTKGYTKEPVP